MLTAFVEDSVVSVGAEQGVYHWTIGGERRSVYCLESADTLNQHPEFSEKRSPFQHSVIWTRYTAIEGGVERFVKLRRRQQW